MPQLWEVVGGGMKGGILVRDHQEPDVAKVEDERLATGALIQELELIGLRLRFLKLKGDGPDEGWIITKHLDKDTCIRSKRKSANDWDPPPDIVGPYSMAPLPTCIVFAGQGSQTVGMLNSVKHMSVVKSMIAKATEICGYDVLELCLEGPAEKLEQTNYCQPALFVAGMAGLEKLRQEDPAVVHRASAMAGFSLGEYTALCAAGVMTFEDGLRLVKLRGEAMQEATEVCKQKMLSVVGLDHRKLERLIRDVSQGDILQVSIYLFAGGATVGGTEEAIERLKDAAQESGAQQVRVLLANGAFHTPHMEPAQQKLNKALDEILPKMKPPLYTVWMNADGRPMRPGTDPKDIVERLKKQLTSPVYWLQTITEIINEDITNFYECGPQKQLRAMMKRINPETWQSMKNVEI